MGSTIGAVPARDGTRLRTRAWAPPLEPWATALLVHGLGEHSGRYERVGGRLAAAGLAVRAYDQRGFGASGGPRSHVERWAEFGIDLADRLDALRSDWPDLPLAVYGHSLGGLIVLDAVTRGWIDPDLVVLSAPALGDTFPRWMRAASRLLSGLLPRVAVRDRLPERGLSRDPRVAAEVAADPLNQTAATIRLGAEAFGAQDELVARLGTLAHLPCPTYVLHGADDPIVPAVATDLLERFPEVTRVVHPGLRHECHNEPEGEAVVDAIVEWLRESTGALPSGQSKIASGERTSAESVARPQTRGT